jgi:predicted PurR-regulated permease PerM
MEPEPFYKKSAHILLAITLLVYILYMLSDILIPLAFAGLFAILLNSVHSKFMQFKIPKVASIVLTLLIAMLVFSGILYFLLIQLMQFGEMLPELQVKSKDLLLDLEIWVYYTFGIGIQKQTQFLSETAGSSKSLIGTTVSGALGVFSVIFLIPIYIFLLLYYKTLILNFFYEAFSRAHSEHVAEVLKETKSAIKSYVVGLLIETLIVAVLNAVALLLLGVEYAILIGVIGAILNLLPYIGGLIAIALPVIMATVTQDGYTTQLLIILAYAVIQFIDNNFLVPLIVSSKVQINALISLLAVLCGAALWGLSGMFLSIPFIAVLKIIFDRVDNLKPWGKLFGDQVPQRHKGEIWRFRRQSQTKITKT